MVREVLVAETLVVVYAARFAELELAFLLLLLLHLLLSLFLPQTKCFSPILIIQTVLFSFGIYLFLLLKIII